MDITTVTYNGKIKIGEEQMFRGAFIKLMGENTNPLLHNHIGDELRYSYPLVQYKVLNDKATLVGIGRGGLAIKDAPRVCELKIGRQKRNFELSNINIEPYTPEFNDKPNRYVITRYLPLNNSNIEEYDGFLALTDKIFFLENIINANILSFFKGIDFHCDVDIQTAITSIDKKYYQYYKGIKFLSFDLAFVTNVLLPDGIGLGKSSSVGFGTLQRVSV